MRGGGMMGFRPLGYQEGGGVPEGGVPIGTGETRMGGFNAPDVQTLVNDLVSVMRDGTEQDVRNFVNSNRYLLEGVANMDIPQARIVRSVLMGTPSPVPTQEEQLLKQSGVAPPDNNYTLPPLCLIHFFTPPAKPVNILPLTNGFKSFFIFLITDSVASKSFGSPNASNTRYASLTFTS